MEKLIESTVASSIKCYWRREWQPTPVYLPGEFHGQRNLAGYSPWGRKESDKTEQLIHTHTHTHTYIKCYMAFPDGSVGKEYACSAGDEGDLGLIPGSRRSRDQTHESHGQRSLEGYNPKGCKELDTTE